MSPARESEGSPIESPAASHLYTRDSIGSTPTPRIAVVGLGAVGSMALLALARRGVPAFGFERFDIGHDRGAFGGGTRRLRYAIPGVHGAAHVLLAQRSVELWRELETLSVNTLYVPTGELAIGPSDDPEILSLQACLRACKLGHDVLTAAEVAQRFPQHVLEPDEIGVFAHDGGPLRSNRAVIAAVRLAESLGAKIVERGAVRSVRHGPDGMLLSTDRSELKFDHVIVTAGPWTGDLVPGMRDAISVRRILSTWFEPGTEASFDPGVFPPGFRRSRNQHAYTFLPGLDEDAAKFIFWIPERPIVSDPSGWADEPDEETVALTTRAVSHTLRDVAATPSRAISYLETFTRDRWPIVHPVGEGMTVLTGFSGSGFALAPVMGEIAADLATNGRTAYGIDEMSLARFA